MKPYRAIPIDGKDFVYGWYVKSGMGCHYIYIGKEGNPIWDIDGCYTKVIPETVGQQLPFDAQNGNKIYEGDVAKHSCGKLFIIESTEIGWNPFDEHCVKPRRIECIVGNIHQNGDYWRNRCEKTNSKTKSETG